MPTIAVDITGRVQGVGFRAFVLRTAEDYGLTGEVWNTRDGGVSLIASNDDVELLSLFVNDLRTGPGRVQTVNQREYPRQDNLTFKIGATR